MSAEPVPLPYRRPLLRSALFLLAAVVIIIFPLVVTNKFYIHLAQTLCYTAVAVIGLNILLGLSGQMSLGQAGFYAAGAYGSALLSARLGWPLGYSMLAGVAIAGLLGAAVGLVALRTRGIYLTMATLAFGFIVEITVQRWTDLTGGTMGVLGIPSLDFGSRKMGGVYFLWVAGAVYLTVQILSDYVFSSRYYRVLLAIKENESAARTTGFNVPVWRTAVFALSAVAAGIAGVFFTHQSAYINSDAFTLNLTLSLLVATVIGGLGTSYGPLIGTIITLAIAEFIASLYDISLLVYGSILLVVLLLVPEGAIGVMRRIGAMVGLGAPRRTSRRVISGSGMPLAAASGPDRRRTGAGDPGPVKELFRCKGAARYQHQRRTWNRACIDRPQRGRQVDADQLRVGSLFGRQWQREAVRSRRDGRTSARPRPPWDGKNVPEPSAGTKFDGDRERYARRSLAALVATRFYRLAGVRTVRRRGARPRLPTACSLQPRSPLRSTAG